MDRRLFWQIGSDHATTSIGDHTLLVEFQQNAFVWSDPDNSNRLMQLMCDDGKAQIRTTHTRGAELIIAYDEIPAPSSSVEIRWRLMESSIKEVLWSVDWLASMQTQTSGFRVGCKTRSKWDCDRVRIRTAEDGWMTLEGNLWTAAADLRAQAISMEFADRFCYLEYIWPADYEGLRLEKLASSVTLSWCLPQPHLEKGVIRRMRLGGCLLNAGFHQATADACYDRFLNSPVPITA